MHARISLLLDTGTDRETKKVYMSFYAAFSVNSSIELDANYCIHFLYRKSNLGKSNRSVQKLHIRGGDLLCSSWFDDFRKWKVCRLFHEFVFLSLFSADWLHYSLSRKPIIFLYTRKFFQNFHASSASNVIAADYSFFHSTSPVVINGGTGCQCGSKRYSEVERKEHVDDMRHQVCPFELGMLLVLSVPSLLIRP